MIYHNLRLFPQVRLALIPLIDLYMCIEYFKIYLQPNHQALFEIKMATWTFVNLKEYILF